MSVRTTNPEPLEDFSEDDLPPLETIDGNNKGTPPIAGMSLQEQARYGLPAFGGTLLGGVMKIAAEASAVLLLAG